MLLEYSHPPTCDIICGIVAKILKKQTEALAIECHANLIDAGLTSIDLVNLMLGIEDEFAITIPQEALRPENFQSLASLTDMVERLRLPPVTAIAPIDMSVVT